MTIQYNYVKSTGYGHSCPFMYKDMKVVTYFIV